MFQLHHGTGANVQNSLGNKAESRVMQAFQKISPEIILL